MKLKRSGFSLVLSLTVMSGMVLMVIVLASFLQIESRLAQSQAGHQRARLNALAAAKMAIGQLQFMMGPDQRVSMRADLYVNDDVPAQQSLQPGVGRTLTSTTGLTIPNPTAPLAAGASSVSHNKRYWTGVWATGGIDSRRVRDWRVENPHDSRLFLGWVVSPTRASSTYPDEINDTDAAGSIAAPGNISIQNYAANRSYFDGTTGAANMNEGQALINGLTSPFLTSAGTPITTLPVLNATVVPLVSRGTVNWPAAVNNHRLWQEYYGAVDAVPLPMPGAYRDAASRTTSTPNGRFAFWVGDEGIKAKVNLPDAYAHNTSGNPMSGLTDWERGLAGSAAQRSALELAYPVTGAPNAQDNRVMLAGLPASFSTDFRNWRNADVTSAANPAALQLARAYTTADVALWAQIQAGGSAAAGNLMRDALRALWPDVTTYSYSTLTDTYSGGPKTDLSTAFELPYSVYRTIEMYPGQKSVATVSLRTQSFFHGAQGPTDLDFNRPNLVDKLGSASDLLRASPRASEWAARYVGPTTFSALLAQIKTRNGGETPERLGFAYEVPLAPAFFNQTRLDATRVAATGTVYYDALPWRALTPTDPDNVMGRIVRGPTWDLYRNYYRTYKREMENAATNGGLRDVGPMTDDDSVAARGVEPLTYATGNRGQPSRRAGPAQGDTYNSPIYPLPDQFYASGAAVTSDRYFHRNNLADSNVQPQFQAERRRLIPYDAGQTVLGGGPSAGFSFSQAAGIMAPTARSGGTAPADAFYDTLQAQTTRTRPTSPAFMPSVLRFSTIYSAVRSGTLMGITVDPIIVLHNPYDAPLEFQGVAMVTSASNNPFRFIFRYPNASFYSTERMYASYNTSNGTRIPPIAWNAITMGPPDRLTGQTIDVGDVVIGDGENDNRSFAFRVVAGAGGTTSSGGRKIRLAPGEVRVISTAPSTDSLDNSGGKNVSVPGDTGFELLSRVFYKMTPYNNIRARFGTGQRDAFSERVVWNLDFDDCKSFAAYDPDGTGPLPMITWTNVGLGDFTYAERLSNIWNDAKNNRRLRDALTFTNTAAAFNPDDELNTWDGTIASLEAKLAGRSMQVLVRNTGWLAYNGRVVGAEGERISVDRRSVYVAPHPRAGEPNLPETRTELPGYVAPAQRSGRVGTHGNLTWNFYLINNRSIDGQQLNTHRRWFGTPDDNPASYIDDGTGRKIRKYREGSETTNGFNLVDEDLLLNFQAMCAGWPMYSNSNHDDGYYVALDREWTRAFGQNPPTPNYYIKGSWSALSASVPTDPEFNDATGKALELTLNKADTLNYSQAFTLVPGTTKAPVFMVDFVRRAADTTRDTALWYPNNVATPNFGNIGTPTLGHDRMQTPPEMRQAPTTPFMIGHRAQQAQLFGYDGKAHTPLGWIEAQRTLDGTLSRAQFPTSDAFRKAFWGRSITDSVNGQDSVILFPIPRRPLLSLAQLGTAPTAEVSTDADLTVGSSFAHPGIGDLSRIIEWPGPRDAFPGESSTEFNALHGANAPYARGPMPELGYVAKAMGTRPVRNRTAPRVDHAFASNLALWDGFYFSGLNLPANSYTPADTPNAWPNGPDLATDPAVRTLQESALAATGVTAATFTALKAALEGGRNPLANKRMTFMPDGRPAANLTSSLANVAQALTENDFPHPKYLAKNSFYNGGFNVNSTSKAAWKSVLGALRGQPLPDLTSGTGTTTALTKFARAIGGTGTDGTEPWTRHRELTDAQIDELAERVVAEVRGRGPFMSLADFINRRLVNSEIYGLKGALQAAIDKADLDSDASRRINLNAITNAGGVFDSPDAPLPGSNWYDPNNIKSNNASPTATSWWIETSAYPKIDPKLRFPNMRAMSRTNAENSVTAGLGAAGIVTQMDVLNSVGPNLTARSDTFVIRAYGEALDNGGRVIGKAWVEVVVQRGMEYMVPGSNGATGDDPNRRRLDYRDGGSAYGTSAVLDPHERNFPVGVTAPTANPANVNRLLGRRFRATSLRWLGANEI